MARRTPFTHKMNRSLLRERLIAADIVPRGGVPLHQVAAQFSSDTKYVYLEGVSTNVAIPLLQHVDGCSFAVGVACECLVTAHTKWCVS